MVAVHEVLQFMDQLAPMRLKMDFDNVGLLVGSSQAEVKKVLVSLDVTKAVIEEAKTMGATLIVSHHPLIFSPLKAVTDTDATGEKVIDLIKNDISLICMHTNLDIAKDGVNDALAGVIGLENNSVLWELGTEEGAPYGLGRVGYLQKEETVSAFLSQVKTAIQSAGLRYYDAKRPVHKVAVMGGSGADALDMAHKAGCDTFVVGEVKYNSFLQAQEYGLNLIEADHFCTENVILEPLAQRMQERFPVITVLCSKVQKQALDFFV